jgi:serine protease AprX
MNHPAARTTGLAALLTAASLALAACAGAGRDPSGGPARAAAQGAPTPCQALYAQPPGRPVVRPGPDGGPGTLILSFVDATARARMVEYINARMVEYINAYPDLGLDRAHVGQLEALPVAAIALPVLDARFAQALASDLEGVLSIVADEPLRELLAESVPLIRADRAWTDLALTGRGVGVAVIDSGVDATHPDLALGRAVARNVSVTGTPELGLGLAVDLPNTDLTSGHGTHVAGIVAGRGDASGLKYRGVAPGATIVGVGAGQGITILSALEGYDFAIRTRAQYNTRVIVNAWGAAPRAFDAFEPVNLASKAAYDAGLTVVFAAGNDGPGAATMNPYAESPCVIAVGATDKAGRLAGFSSRGTPGAADDHPDLVAPGVDIVAPRALSGVVAAPNLGDPTNALSYSSLSGTSMAAPHVAGAAAILLQARPDWRMDDVLRALAATARPAGEAWEAGAGLIDVRAAAALALRGR